MSHSHSDSSSNLKVAFFLNVTFTVIEIVGGLWTNSIAILTDALHDFGDSASLGLAWYFERVSHKERTPQHSYGYKRYRLLGGLISGVLLIAGLGFVLWHAVLRLMEPEVVNAPGMMILAVVGILFNGAGVLRTKRGSSLTERVVSWHLLEDTLGWLAVLLGAAVMAFWDAPIVDPLLSIGISLFVLWNVGRNLGRVMSVFVQGVPDGFDLATFEKDAEKIEGVVGVHHTHCWSLDGESHVLSTHLVMDQNASRVQVVEAKRLVSELVAAQEFEHIAIDVELEGEACVIPEGDHAGVGMAKD